MVLNTPNFDPLVYCVVDVSLYITGPSRMVGFVYLFSSLLLNAGFVYHAWKLKFSPQPNSAMETFKFSIYHLLALFVALLADHYLGSLFSV